MKIIAILGMTATGKASVARLLTKDGRRHRVVPYTTRPKRDYEVKDEDYHFICDTDFETIYRQGCWLESTQYFINGKVYSYATNLESFVNDKTNVVVTNPYGLKMIKSRLSDDDEIVVVYLEKTLDERILNYMCHEDDDNIESYQRLIERLKRDEKDYKYFIDDYDPKYVVNNQKTLDLCIKELESKGW